MSAFSRRRKLSAGGVALAAGSSRSSGSGNLPRAGCQPQHPGTPRVQNIPAGQRSFKCERRSQYGKTDSGCLCPSVGIRVSFHEKSLKIGP